MLIFLFSVFIAFALGLILFFSVQDKIPDELSILKGGATPTSARVAASGATSAYKNWDIYNEGASKVTLVNGTSFVKRAGKNIPFIVSIECSSSGLSAFLQYAPGLNFTTKDRSDTAVMYMNDAKVLWEAIPEYTDKYKNKNPIVLINALAAPSVKTEFLEPSKADQNSTVVEIDTSGLPELIKQFPSNCLK